MVKVQIFEKERKRHPYLWAIVGGILLVIGILMLVDYIYHFVKIFLGLLMIGVGSYLIFSHKGIKNFLFFRF